MVHTGHIPISADQLAELDNVVSPRHEFILLQLGYTVSEHGFEEFIHGLRLPGLIFHLVLVETHNAANMNLVPQGFQGDQCGLIHIGIKEQKRDLTFVGREGVLKPTWSQGYPVPHMDTSSVTDQVFSHRDRRG